MGKEENVAQGRKNRAAGATFERKVRADLEEQGYNVDKWGNVVKDGKVKTSSGIFNPRTKTMMMSKGGFPDFIAYRTVKNKRNGIHLYEVLGIECKINGYLTPREKEMCAFYEKNEIFTRIVIAKREKVGNKNIIIYTNFNQDEKTDEET